MYIEYNKMLSESVKIVGKFTRLRGHIYSPRIGQYGPNRTFTTGIDKSWKICICGSYPQVYPQHYVASVDKVQLHVYI